jgi:hypothetical protein
MSAPESMPYGAAMTMVRELKEDLEQKGFGVWQALGESRPRTAGYPKAVRKEASVQTLLARYRYKQSWPELERAVCNSARTTLTRLRSS